MFHLVSAILLGSVSTPTVFDPYYEQPPTVDVSAVRSIRCGLWIGSGFLIGDKIMATALHVVKDARCFDVDTGSPLTVYKIDPKHDLALVTSPKLPTNIPYIQISCSRYKKGERYLSWGRTFYGMPDYNVITRMNALTATDKYTAKGYTLDDGSPAEDMRVLAGFTAPGMSGGPITNLNGYALSLNNAGSTYRSITYEFADGMLCQKQ